VTTNNNNQSPPTIPKNRLAKNQEKSVQTKKQEFLNKKK